MFHANSCNIGVNNVIYISKIRNRTKVEEKNQHQHERKTNEHINIRFHNLCIMIVFWGLNVHNFFAKYKYGISYLVQV